MTPPDHIRCDMGPVDSLHRTRLVHFVLTHAGDAAFGLPDKSPTLVATWSRAVKTLVPRGSRGGALWELMR